MSTLVQRSGLDTGVSSVDIRVQAQGVITDRLEAAAARPAVAVAASRRSERSHLQRLSSRRRQRQRRRRRRHQQAVAAREAMAARRRRRSGATTAAERRGWRSGSEGCSDSRSRSRSWGQSRALGHRGAPAAASSGIRPSTRAFLRQIAAGATLGHPLEVPTLLVGHGGLVGAGLRWSSLVGRVCAPAAMYSPDLPTAVHTRTHNVSRA